MCIIHYGEIVGDFLVNFYGFANQCSLSDLNADLGWFWGNHFFYGTCVTIISFMIVLHGYLCTFLPMLSGRIERVYFIRSYYVEYFLHYYAFYRRFRNFRSTLCSLIFVPFPYHFGYVSFFFTGFMSKDRFRRPSVYCRVFY